MIGRWQHNTIMPNYFDQKVEEAEDIVQKLENDISSARKEVTKLRRFIKWLKKTGEKRERSDQRIS